MTRAIKVLALAYAMVPLAVLSGCQLLAPTDERPDYTHAPSSAGHAGAESSSGAGTGSHAPVAAPASSRESQAAAIEAAGNAGAAAAAAFLPPPFNLIGSGLIGAIAGYVAGRHRKAKATNQTTTTEGK